MTQFYKASNVQMAFEYLLQFIRDPNRGVCAIQPTFSDYSECKRPTLLFKTPFGQNSFVIYASTQFVDAEAFFGAAKTLDRLGFYNRKGDKLYNVSKGELLRIVGSHNDEDYRDYGQDILGGYIELPYEEDGPVHEAVKEKVAAMAVAEFPYNAETVAKAKEVIAGDKGRNANANRLGGIKFENGENITLSTNEIFPFPLNLSNGYKTDVLLDNLLSGPKGIDLLAADTYRANKDDIRNRVYFCYVAKAAFEELEKQPGWHHAMRALSKGIHEYADDANMLRVEVSNGQRTETIRMPKTSMLNHEFWGFMADAPSRPALKEMFGDNPKYADNDGSFTIKDIVKVTYGKKVIYDRATVQNLPAGQ